MAATYTWIIETMERDVATGGVKTAHWRCNAVDGEHATAAYGTVGFTFDPDAPDFVPYENLTQDQVLTWVWGSEEVDKDGLEAALASKLDQMINPVTAAGLPWGSA